MIKQVNISELRNSLQKNYQTHQTRLVYEKTIEDIQKNPELEWNSTYSRNSKKFEKLFLYAKINRKFLVKLLNQSHGSKLYVIYNRQIFEVN